MENSGRTGLVNLLSHPVNETPPLKGKALYKSDRRFWRQCSGCPSVAYIVSHNGVDKGPLCQPCTNRQRYRDKSLFRICSRESCGLLLQVGRMEDGKPVCMRCVARERYQDRSNRMRCSGCKRLKFIVAGKTEGAPICSRCYADKIRAETKETRCPRCRNFSIFFGRSKKGNRVCKSCCQKENRGTCVKCRERNLWIAAKGMCGWCYRGNTRVKKVRRKKKKLVPPGKRQSKKSVTGIKKNRKRK